MPIGQKKYFLVRFPLACRENKPRPVQRLHSDGILTAARALLSLSPSSNESTGDDKKLSCYRSHSTMPPKILGLPMLLDNIDSCSEESSEMTSLGDDGTQSEWGDSSSHPPHRYYTGSTSLTLEQDEESLSPLHCFMRRYCVEAFTASAHEVSTPRNARTNGHRIVEGQVGIRCIHCKHRPQRQERAVCFPSSLKNIYHSIETWQRRHSLVCHDIPAWIKVNLTKLIHNSRSGAGGRRKYWEESARRIGIMDTKSGLRFIRLPGEVLSPSEVSDAEDETTSSSVTATCATSQPVVSSEDKKLVTGYLFVLLEQMETCQFSEQDRTGGRSKNKDLYIGFPGLQCKYCGGKAGFGRYFPASLRALTSANSDRNIYNHILKCRRCPHHIREELYRLQREHNQKNCKNRRGWRKMFFRRVWENLHGASSCEETEQGRDTSDNYEEL
jgi:hypothetical protein